MRTSAQLVLIFLCFGSLALGACGGGGSGDPLPTEELLGTVVYDRTGSLGGVSVTGFEVLFGHGDPGSGQEIFPVTPPLTGWVGGTEYETAAGANVLVDGYFAYLTDGVDGRLFFGVQDVPPTGPAGFSPAESVCILNRHSSLGGPDFTGATVTRVVLTLTSGTVTVGDPASYDLVGIVSYFGTVP